MPKQFAIGHGNRVSLWCEDRGNGKGWVINGEWLYPDDAQGGAHEIVWCGEVPSPYNADYNEAINWIESEIANSRESIPGDPEVGSIWRHRNGNIYTVEGIANLPDDERYPKTVIYRGGNGNLWARRADDWHRSMTEEH